METRVEFLEVDLVGALKDRRETFDVLVTNPPYIDETTRDTIQPEVRDHEPSIALFAPDHGLAISKRILTECAPWLKPRGWLGMEFGINQQDALHAAATATGIFDEVIIEKDHTRIPRYLHARKK